MFERNEVLLDSIRRKRQTALTQHRLTATDHNEANRKKRIFERLWEDTTVQVRAGVEVPGDTILRNLRETIRRFRLTKQQLLFTELFNQSQLVCIYGDDFFANEMRIMEENDMSDLYQFALVCCPRRFGKTYCTAIWAACLLACVPDTKIVLYSPGQRQSMYIMELIREHLEFLKQFIDWEIVPGKDNKEILAIRVNGNERIIQGLPAAEATTRGSGGTCIICEEAAAMPAPFFVRVVLPVTAPAKTSCICISTIQSENSEGVANWFSILLDEAFPDGRPMFNTFKFLLSCDKCIAEGKAASCIHKMHEIPFWADAGKQTMTSQIMKDLGFAEAAEQELRGVTSSSLKAVLPEKHLVPLFNSNINQPIHKVELQDTDVHTIFASVDVSLGGKGSNTALASGFFYHGQLVLLGGETIPNLLDDEYRPLIIQHIKRIRATFPRSKIIMIIENNTQGPARNVANDILQLCDPMVSIMRKDPSQDIISGELYKGRRAFGVSTQGGRAGQGNVKEEMIMCLREIVIREQLRFFKEFIVVTPKLTPHEYKVGLFNQLKNLSKKHQLATSDFQMPKYTYSAKHAGPDDDCMAVCLLGYWGTVFLTRDPESRI